MKRIICLAMAAALVGTLTGCETAYYERQEYPAGYVSTDYGYAPATTYRSESDYYRHYNGIDG